MAQNHDSIFYYSKSNQFTFHLQYLPHDEKYLFNFYKFTEPETGRIYRLADLTNPNKDRPNLTYEFLGVKRVWRWTRERMEEAYKKGIVVQTKAGAVPALKRYLDEQEGTPLDDCWFDIVNVQSSKEKMGYPTQKPEILLTRIIEMATNENDVVLDPFVGGGTTVVVADKLKRRWIGIDQSVQAIKVTEFRMNLQQHLLSSAFVLQLHKYDYDTLRYKDAFEFESFIIQQFGGIENKKQRGDLGLDGKTKENVPIQVKRSDDIGRNVIDNFFSAIQRYDKKLFDKNKLENQPVGYIIAFSFGKGAIQEVARLKNTENVIIKLMRVDEIVPIAKKPSLKVEVKDCDLETVGNRTIQFIAEGKSNSGIEFYAWDFEYQVEKGFRPEIMLDKDGVQIRKFKSGTHLIAVKVVDSIGLDNLETIKIKINGELTIN
jgi:hypothetical protein